jgi:hypothetical protein
MVIIFGGEKTSVILVAFAGIAAKKIAIKIINRAITFSFDTLKLQIIQHFSATIKKNGA